MGSKGGIFETTARGVDGGEENTVVKESNCCNGAGACGLGQDKEGSRMFDAEDDAVDDEELVPGC